MTKAAAANSNIVTCIKFSDPIDIGGQPITRYARGEEKLKHVTISVLGSFGVLVEAKGLNKRTVPMSNVVYLDTE